jgi:hypothetical protein
MRSSRPSAALRRSTSAWRTRAWGTRCLATSCRRSIASGCPQHRRSPYQERLYYSQGASWLCPGANIALNGDSMNLWRRMARGVARIRGLGSQGQRGRWLQQKSVGRRDGRHLPGQQRILKPMADLLNAGGLAAPNWYSWYAATFFAAKDPATPNPRTTNHRMRGMRTTSTAIRWRASS